MTTVADLIERTRTDFLSAGAPENRNKLNGAVSDSAGTLTVTYSVGGIQAGSRISVDLEDMHVWMVDGGTKEITVERGIDATTAATHSDGALVEVNPRYSDARILRALNSAVGQLVSEGIYQVETVELTHTPSTYGYEIDVTGFLGVISVWKEDIHYASGDLWSPLEWFKVQTSADTTDFPSGVALFPKEYADDAATLRVQCKKELSATLAAKTDVVETVVGVESEAVDLISMGAAIELIAGREIERNEQDVNRPRRDEEVPAGAWGAAGQALRQLYRDRVKAERNRLDRKYPKRLKAR